MSGLITPPHLRLRKTARCVVTWDMDTGEFNYETAGANMMEQLGMLAYAQQTIWATTQKGQPQVRLAGPPPPRPSNGDQ